MTENAFKSARLNADFRHVPTWRLKLAYRHMFRKWQYHIDNNWIELSKDFELSMRKIAEELDYRTKAAQ